MTAAGPRALDDPRLQRETSGRRGKLLVNVPMSRYSVWGVGGAADRLYKPADPDDLASFLAQQPEDEAIFFLGLGSNLLVRDGGIRGTVVALAGHLDRLAQVGPDIVRAEAGVPSAKLARFCAQRGLRGGEFLSGIPGTVGGALAINAGAFGDETWNIVRRVETVDRRGRLRTREKDEYRVAYRHVEGPAARGQAEGRAVNEWFVAGEFQLTPGDSAEGFKRIRQLLRRRGATQPTGQRSCGSVFKNPPGDHAGRLIDISGLKCLSVGDAVVSEKHANFILNTGRATAADIESLINRVAEVVAQTHGVQLVPEVRIVGSSEPRMAPSA